MRASNPFGLALTDAVGGPLVETPAPAPATPGMSKGQMILGILADALSGAQGRPGAFAAQMNQQRQQQQEQAQWGLQRRAGLEDYEAKQKIEQRYAKPPTPHRWEDNAGNQWEMDSQTGQPKRFFTDTSPKYVFQDGMMVNIPNPYAGGQAATSAPPPTIDEDLWNTGKPLGGQTPSASATFRR
jgi:hypothetical protein